MTSHKIITVLCKFLSDTIRGTPKLESFYIKEPKNIVPKSTEADAWNVQRELDSCLLLSRKALNSISFSWIFQIAGISASFIYVGAVLQPGVLKIQLQGRCSQLSCWSIRLYLPDCDWNILSSLSCPCV